MQFLFFGVFIFLHFSCATTKVSPSAKTITPSLTQVKPTQLIDTKDMHNSHYVGIFQNDRLKKSFPAILDLVVKSGKDNLWKLAGVLRVYAAAKDKSAPYQVISSYYNRIALHDQELSFAVKHQQIRIVKKGRWEQDKITAYVVVYGFGQGQLHLHKLTRTNFSLPMPAAQRPMALSAFKLPRTKFPQHVFAAQGMEKTETGLLNTSKNLLQKNLFDVNYDSIDRFGVYYGVLHHEQLNAFQYLRLAFLEDREMGTTTAVSTLFFAEPQDKEFIVYRHHAGREVMRGVTPLLLGNDSENEAFMLLDRWDKHGISGVWYSKVHGRIGKIFLMRQHFPRLAADAVLVPSLRGRKREAHFAIELQVQNGLAKQAEVIFPAKISGRLNDIDQEKTHPLTSGDYDFYRGLVKLSYEGGAFFYSVFDKKYK